MSYGYDTNILDAGGNRLVSYGPRRIEIERVVGGKSYVSYRQHHPENDDSGAHIEACLPAEAAFWGVYKHDAEGLAAIVGDAHDEVSAKAFAEQVARNLELEAQLIAAVHGKPRLFSSLVNVELDHWRAKRIEQGVPRYIVDGHEFPNEESNFLSTGEYPPFVVFDVDQQENLPGEYGTRAEADQVAALKNAGTPRWEASTKAFAEHVARKAAINATPRIVLVLEGDHIRNALADCAVDVICLNYDDDRIEEFAADGMPVVDVPQTDGTVEQAVVSRIAVEVDPEETAQVARLCPGLDEDQHFVVLGINTNHAAFVDLGHAYEVAHLLRSAASKVEVAVTLDDIPLFDTNGNEAGWLSATHDAQRPALGVPGMIHLVVDADGDRAFGTTEGDRKALASSFRILANQLDDVKDLSARIIDFTVATVDAHGNLTGEVKAGRFHYTPAPTPELKSPLAPRDAAAPEI